MVEPDDKGRDEAVPPEGQPASSSETAAASGKPGTSAAAAEATWAEVFNAMRSAEEAVSNAVQGVAKIHNKPQ